MMKKYSLIAALVIALTFAFVGCSGTLPGDDDDGDRTGSGELKWKTVFEMSAHAGIQALPEGVIAVADDATMKPFNRAGGAGVSISAVKVNDKISLQFTTTENWGAGIDLPFPAFGFRVGDKITIKGELAGAAGYTQPNFKIGSEDGHGKKQSTDGEFTWEITLDAGMVGEIKAANPQAIRIESRGTGGNTVPTGQTVKIFDVKIEGNRPTEIVDCEAPVLKVSGNVVSWEAVEGASGYKVFVEGEQTPLATLPSTATSYDLLNANIAEGKYKIQAQAIGTDGETRDSKLSDAVEVTRQLPQVEITLGAAKVSVGMQPRGGGKVETSGSIFTYTAGSGGYENVYAVFDLKLPTGEKLSDYHSIVFSYFAVEGDAQSKEVLVLASETTGLTSNVGGSDRPAAASPEGGLVIARSNNLNGNPAWATIASANRAISNAERLDSETTVRIGFYIHASNKGGLVELDSFTKFKIANIAFTK